MNNYERISIIFWKHFEPYLVRQIRVYFCFYESLVDDLVCSEFKLEDSKKAFEIFKEAVKELIEIDNGSILLKKDVVFNKMSNGKSPLIVLIALQVLAVEKMSNLNEKVSKQSYFPILRMLVDESLGQSNKLPFKEDEFDLMWKKFGREVRSYYSGEVKLTFNIESKRKGPYKNKDVPLSQALLDMEDLLKLGREYHKNKNKYESFNRFDWKSFLSDYSKGLSHRGELCVGNNMLIKPIKEQFKNFVNNVDIETLTSIINEVKNQKLNFDVLFRIDEDFYEGYRYKMRFQKDEEYLDTGKGIELLRNYFEKKDYLVLRIYHDYYLGEPYSTFTLPLSYLAFLVKNMEGERRIKTALSKDQHLEFERFQIVESDFSILFITETDEERFLARDFKVNRGELALNKEIQQVVIRGGIRINERGFTFLSGFPPKEIEVNNEKIRDDDILLCNNLRYSWKELKISFDKSEYSFCKLKFKDVTFSVTFKDVKIENPMNIGYLIEQNSIDLTQKEVEQTDSYLAGFSFFNFLETISIKKNDYLLFMIDSDEFMDKIDTNEIDVLIKSIEESDSIGNTHKQYLKNLISEKKMAPKTVLNRIKQETKIKYLV